MRLRPARSPCPSTERANNCHPSGIPASSDRPLPQQYAATAVCTAVCTCPDPARSTAANLRLSRTPNRARSTERVGLRTTSRPPPPMGPPPPEEPEAEAQDHDDESASEPPLRPMPRGSQRRSATPAPASSGTGAPASSGTGAQAPAPWRHDPEPASRRPASRSARPEQASSRPQSASRPAARPASRPPWRGGSSGQPQSGSSTPRGPPGLGPEDDLPSAKELFGNLNIDDQAFDVLLPNRIRCVGELDVAPRPQPRLPCVPFEP